VTTYLLDVNLLLALADPMHIHHEAAHRWFEGRGHQSWATCPITENGFVRVASHPNYPNRPGDVLAVLAILSHLREVQGHEFWAEDVGILDILAPGAIITHAQVTDVYLAGLAVHRGGKLATLDQRIPVDAIRGGKRAVELIPG
jgi:uncharacterized protein